MATAPAATRRTTVRKNTDPTHVDFDASRKKKGKGGKVCGSLTAFGKTWDLKRPNIALVGELEKTEDIQSLTAYVIAHVVEAQRSDLLAAMLADEALDMEEMMILGNDVTNAVYSDIPTPP